MQCNASCGRSCPCSAWHTRPSIHARMDAGTARLAHAARGQSSAVHTCAKQRRGSALRMGCQSAHGMPICHSPSGAGGGGCIARAAFTGTPATHNVNAGRPPRLTSHPPAAEWVRQPICERHLSVAHAGTCMIVCLCHKDGPAASVQRHVHAVQDLALHDAHAAGCLLTTVPKSRDCSGKLCGQALLSQASKTANREKPLAMH